MRWQKKKPVRRTIRYPSTLDTERHWQDGQLKNRSVQKKNNLSSTNLDRFPTSHYLFLKKRDCIEYMEHSFGHEEARDLLMFPNVEEEQTATTHELLKMPCTNETVSSIVSGTAQYQHFSLKTKLLTNGHDILSISFRSQNLTTTLAQMVYVCM